MADTSGDNPVLSSDARPLTSAVLTVRIIKSFPYRTSKNLVLRDLDLTTTTVGGLIDKCKEAIATQVGFKLYRNVKLDTLKLYTVAHGHKNLIINLDHDEWIFTNMDQTLADAGCENETELSLFNRADYDAFKANPEIKWD